MIGDNGSGISDEIKDNIFEPFVKTKDEKFNKNSSGIGLSITKAIVEKHGGKIEVNLNKNNGCEFIIKLLL